MLRVPGRSVGLAWLAGALVVSGGCGAVSFQGWVLGGRGGLGWAHEKGGVGQGSGLTSNQETEYKTPMQTSHVQYERKNTQSRTIKPCLGVSFSGGRLRKNRPTRLAPSENHSIHCGGESHMPQQVFPGNGRVVDLAGSFPGCAGGSERYVPVLQDTHFWTSVEETPSAVRCTSQNPDTVQIAWVKQWCISSCVGTLRVEYHRVSKLGSTMPPAGLHPR
jgi:hypothetical protein